MNAATLRASAAMLMIQITGSISGPFGMVEGVGPEILGLSRGLPLSFAASVPFRGLPEDCLLPGALPDPLSVTFCYTLLQHDVTHSRRAIGPTYARLLGRRKDTRPYPPEASPPR